MDVSFRCPHCEKSLRGRMRSQARTLKCPSCQGEAKVTLPRSRPKPIAVMATPVDEAPSRFGEFVRSARVPLMLGAAFAAGAFFAFSGSGPDLTAGEVADSAGHVESGGGPLSSSFFMERNPAAESGRTEFAERRADGSLVRMPLLRPVSAGKDVASGDFPQMPQLQDGSPGAGKFNGKFDGDCAKFGAEAQIKAQEQCAVQDAASASVRFDAECGDKSSKADFNFDAGSKLDAAAGSGAGGGSFPGVRAKFSAGKPGNGKSGNGQFGNDGGFKSRGCRGKQKSQQQSFGQPGRIPKSKDGNPSA